MIRAVDHSSYPALRCLSQVNSVGACVCNDMPPSCPCRITEKEIRTGLDLVGDHHCDPVHLRDPKNLVHESVESLLPFCKGSPSQELVPVMCNGRIHDYELDLGAFYLSPHLSYYKFLMCAVVCLCHDDVVEYLRGVVPTRF